MSCEQNKARLDSVELPVPFGDGSRCTFVTLILEDRFNAHVYSVGKNFSPAKVGPNHSTTSCKWDRIAAAAASGS